MMMPQTSLQTGLDANPAEYLVGEILNTFPLVSCKYDYSVIAS